MNIKRNIIFALESRKKNGVPVIENAPIRMRVIFARSAPSKRIKREDLILESMAFRITLGSDARKMSL